MKISKIIPALFILIYTLNANSIELKSKGIKTGLNLSNIHGDMYPALQMYGIDENMDYRLGYTAGIFAEIGFDDRLSIQPEALFSTRGFVHSNLQQTSELGELIATIDFHYIFHYIDLPVLCRYNLDLDSEVSPYIYFGPCVSYFSRSMYKIKGGTNDGASDDIYTSYMKRWELSGIIGLGVHYNQFLLEVRFLLAFTDHYEFNDAKNYAWSVLIGYDIPIDLK